MTAPVPSRLPRSTTRGEQPTDGGGEDFHHAENAEQRGEGICRTCMAPIWDEGGTVGHRHREEGWSDRIERGGDSLVCFKAVHYRHVPLEGREAAIYDAASNRARAALLAEQPGGGK